MHDNIHEKIMHFCLAANKCKVVSQAQIINSVLLKL